MPNPSPFDLKRIAQLALYVIVRPTDYFRTMPRSGSLAEPLWFCAVLGVVATLISAVVEMLISGESVSVLLLVAMAPGLIIAAALFGSGILMLLWKLLGSRQSYQVAFRCTAATLAISPITAVLAFVPYVGLVINIVWTMYLLTVASVEVHGIGRRKAGTAFAILGVLLALSTWFMYTSQVVLEQQLQEQGISIEEFQQMPAQQQREVLERLMGQMQSSPGPATLD